MATANSLAVTGWLLLLLLLGFLPLNLAICD